MQKNYFSTKLFVTLPLLGLTVYSEAKNPQPNVLLIVTDDQGIGDFGFVNPLVKTPTIDMLMKESASFTNFVACPASSPSRASLYTGRNHLITGVWGVPPRSNMQPDETLMPRFMKSAGYNTLLLGKRDCTQPVGCEPWEAGWDNGFTVTGYQQKDPKMGTKSGMVARTGYTSEIMSDEAVKFINSKSEKPWLISLNFITPHMPWVCSQEFAAPYIQAGCSESLAQCWGAITQMDAALGRVLEVIKNKGLEQNTIVILYSDNGATSPEVQKLVGRVEQEVPGEDWQKRNALKLRAYKSSTYQNGMRVPLLIKYPKIVQVGERNQFARIEDVLPTLLDITGFDFSTVKHQPFDGISFAANLKNADKLVDVPPAFRINIAHEGSPRTKNGIIADPTKLKLDEHHLALQNERYVFHNLPGGRHELYDLSNDPGEKNNLATKMPDLTNKMAQECKNEWTRIINSGRAFNMPALQIGRLLWDGKPEECNVFLAGYIKSLKGNISQAVSLQGFTAPGDEVMYRLDVVTPAEYFIFLRGNNFDKCQALKIEIAGNMLTGEVLSANEICFGSVRLDKSTKQLVCKAAGTTLNAENAEIYNVVFSKTYEEGKSDKPIKQKKKNAGNDE